MSRRHWFGLTLSFVFALIVTVMARCSSRPMITVEADASFEIYSLDGDSYPMSSANWRDSGFHSWPILKTCTISHAKGVELLDELLSDAASDAAVNALPIDCFRPRHGLRVNDSSGTTDYLICFECRRFETWSGGRQMPGGGSITRGPESLLSNTLKTCRSVENVQP